MTRTNLLLSVLGLILMDSTRFAHAESDPLDAAVRKLEKQANRLMDQGEAKLAELIDGTAEYLSDIAAEVHEEDELKRREWEGMVKKLDEVERHRHALRRELESVKHTRNPEVHEQLVQELSEAREECEHLAEENAQLRRDRDELLERVHVLEREHLELERERLREELNVVRHEQEQLTQATQRTQREMRQSIQQVIEGQNRDSMQQRNQIVERVERLEREGRDAIERLGQEFRELRQFVKQHVAEQDE